ncbi:MAG: ornithine cyclodeaminase family protein [Myxococcota bacterium]
MALTLRVLDAEAIDAVGDMRALIEAVGHAFAELSRGVVSAPERAVVSSPGGTTLVMGASVPEQGLVTKVVSVFGGNQAQGLPTTIGLAVVLDPRTGAPIGLCDGARLTAWRTGAASGLATSKLARPDAKIGALIGCGAQARTQLLGSVAVRELSEVRVFGPRPSRVATFIEHMQPRVSARLVPASGAKAAIDGADVVCVATSSRTPVLDGADLAPGTHINAVGTFRLDMRELDVTTVHRASVFIDQRAAARAEAGDLMAAEQAGVTSSEAWTELGRVVSGDAPGRRSNDEITLFKSVGLAVQDVAAAAVFFEAAQAADLGHRISL